MISNDVGKTISTNTLNAPKPTVPTGKSSSIASTSASQSANLPALEKALIGGGPRTTNQIAHLVKTAVDLKPDFEALQAKGAKYQINITAVEKGGPDWLGRGNAFTASHTGMVNTGAEGNYSITQAINPDDPIAKQAADLVDYQKRLTAKFGQNAKSHAAELEKTNLPGAVMFEKANENGLHTDAAFTSRGNLGDEEAENFQNALKLAKNHLPFLNIDVKTNTQASNLDISNPTRPSVDLTHTDASGEKKTERRSFDAINLNTGTTVSSPIRDPKAAARSFIKPMNPADMAHYLNDKNLLDDAGQLKPGSKVISGGTGLSGLDQIAALSNFMNLFERDSNDPVGYKVTDSAKEKYQDTIHVVSRGPSNCPPRHSHSPEWTAKTQPMGDTAALHALFLDGNGSRVMSDWPKIEKASIARALNTTPGQLTPKFEKAEDLAKYQYENTKKSMTLANQSRALEKTDPDKSAELKRESHNTPFGQSRNVQLGTILGFGMSRDLEATGKEMSKRAPNTWQPGYATHRAQLAGISEPASASIKSNAGLMGEHGQRMGNITSSPAVVHSMLPKLYEAGIARHVPASYSDVKADPEGNGLTLKGQSYGALVVSPTFDPNSEPTYDMKGKVKPLHPQTPGFPEIGKFRSIVNADGQNTNVSDFGLHGKGTTITAEDGKRSSVGVVSVDTNNRESAADVAPSVALRTMSEAHLKASGSNDPVGELNSIYESIRPSKGEHAREARSFEGDFRVALDKSSYLTAIEKIAGDDGDLYAKLYDQGHNATTRKAAAFELLNNADPKISNAAKEYFEELDNQPRFRPADRDSYSARFVDSKPADDLKAYDIARDRAASRLGSKE